ncbi:DNA phosphorothioation-associated putative methyltransferase [Gloeothece verrucosa]|uniref:DNA phosphorothioation-associated putative methyltransferase n=1 Tax=Gloeothece verrucosa TaxID=2546359 RepID=UPI0007C712DD
MPEQFNEIVFKCQNSSVGKLLPNALYIHTCALSSLDKVLQEYERLARITEIINRATLIKFSIDKPKISYLFYPDFDQNPHPALKRSIVVDMETLLFNEWDYSNSDNPPILHRKETFVTPSYPHYQEFAHLTRSEIALGLLDNSRYIGTLQDWENRLNHHAIAFEGHYLVCPLSNKPGKPVFIERHKAAIVRKTLSRPVRLALESGLFTPGVTTFFDYGCGYGGDIERIAKQGYESQGWDPYYRPESPLIAADIVNLGYIINVIEDLEERRTALIKAWELTRQVLIVAAQVLIDDCDRGIVVYGDGIITRRNTFQKYYQQEELKIYIDQVLNVDAIPLGLGIYLVFRSASAAEAFRVSRFHSRATTPPIQKQLKHFYDYEDLLTPLMKFFTERGRLPVKGELENESELKDEFKTIRRGFEVVLQVTKLEDWEAITEKRRQDLLLYLALSKFTHRPSSRELATHVREDLKGLFGGYQQACLLADLMLTRLRDLDKIAQLCQSSPVGKKLKNSLLIHISALESLPTLLRLYEGCASRTVGRLEDANLIQFSYRHPKITYLFYPDFDRVSHPTLHTSMQIYLSDLQVHYRDFSEERNPPILSEKDLLVNSDYPLYEKFARLTQQEKDWGLLDDFKTISRLQGWLNCLKEHCATIKGHTLQWAKDADPYKVKLLRAQIKTRQRERKRRETEEINPNES